MVMTGARPPFDISYAGMTQAHLRAIDARYHRLIQTTIEARLSHEPDVEARNRKPLRREAGAAGTWELRFGPDNRFRVLYDVEPRKRRIVILAIGIKLRGRLFIGGEEVEL